MFIYDFVMYLTWILDLHRGLVTVHTICSKRRQGSLNAIYPARLQGDELNAAARDVKNSISTANVAGLAAGVKHRNP